MSSKDTIAAISTPLGEGGIGILRLSGSESIEIADKIVMLPKDKKLLQADSHQINLAHVVNPKTKEVLDEVLISVMKAPKTYTREDVVEINCHGGIIALQETLKAAVEAGARLAQPGEFTKRAFLNGRIDLAQAEAVIDIICSKTKEGLDVAMKQLGGGLSKKISEIRQQVISLLVQTEASIEFSEEDLEILPREEIQSQIRSLSKELKMLIASSETGKIYRDGVDVVIAGRPNVGKSSLMNALLREARAIVTSVPGTTRDIVEEIINLSGVPFKLRDTAGIRSSRDEVEKIGVELSHKAIEGADVVLAIFDSSEPLSAEDIEILNKTNNRRTIIVINKIDLPQKIDRKKIAKDSTSKQLAVSATEGTGLEELEKAMLDMVLSGQVTRGKDVIVANVRHQKALEKAKKNLDDALKGLSDGVPEEFISAVLRDVLDDLGEISGETVHENILEKIFSQFCIGK